MNNNGQRRYARKQKKNRKQQQKRYKVAKSYNNNKCDQQSCHSDRVMNVSDVINAISLYCYNAILKNEQQKSTPRRQPSNSYWTPPSIFNDPDLVNVSRPSQEQIHHFIKIIFDKRKLAAETGVMGYVLILRTNTKITSANWMRLVMISLLLANKEAEDVYTVWNVRFVGIIPNLQVYEINLLELEFLQNIKYRLHVEKEAYNYNYQQLVSYLPLTEQSITDLEDLNNLSDSECLISSRWNSSFDLLSECIDCISESPPTIAQVEEKEKDEDEENEKTEDDMNDNHSLGIQLDECTRTDGQLHDKMHTLHPTETLGGLVENVSHIESIP